jgi:chitodextrinase
VVVRDSIAPTQPGNLVAGVTDSTATLNWIASSDFIGVTGYKVYKDGQLAGTTASNTFTFIGLLSSVNYTFTVLAFDKAGNISVPASIEVLTPDTQLPVSPNSLTSTKTTSHRIELKWLASTDNVGVVGYNLYRNGQKINTSMITSLSFITDRPIGNNVYEFTVRAIDAAGNMSLASNIERVQNGQAGDKSQSFAQSELFDVTHLNLNREDISVYPNPSKGKFRVKVSSITNGKLSINVYSANGILVKSIIDSKSGDYDQELNLTGFPAGTYIIKVSVDHFIRSRTLIVEN